MPQTGLAIDTESYVSTHDDGGWFALSQSGTPAPLVVSWQDYPGVQRVAGYFQADIERVTHTVPELHTDRIPDATDAVVIGTIGKSPMIDRLVESGRLDVTGIAGRRETFLIETLDTHAPGRGRILVIAGSDKRGTIYGMFDLSAQIGVSPWYWWADVPTAYKPDLYVQPGRHTDGEPKVTYRGIFLNDEDPALGGWAREFYGGLNHEPYEKIFELILRLKGNYIWPAMWEPRSFYEDDPLTPQLADELGIVYGTTHHEPLMRAHADWDTFGGDDWNYETNPEQLREFWTEGMERTKDFEKIVTVGMRGDGDMGMSRDTNIALLERIISDQRDIIEQVTGKDAAETPQLWALYKEVQEYYDLGMRVPDDVTLLLCDDNWGNIRKLPKPGDPPRSGGYGIYYHFDYVGGPRNYKWLNTTQIARTMEQMHLAYRHGVDRIWIVNVGDLKPMEFPIEFFLDYAWDPDNWPAERLPEYTRRWAAREFGEEHAASIAHLMTAYTTFNARRKPELLSPDTYSLDNYHEADRIVADYNALVAEADRINEALPEQYHDAYYQLILHPIRACANLNELYVTAAKNRRYAAQGRARTNDLAARVRELFAYDAELTDYYNHELADGKWNHMMDQTHIGYRYWQQPPENTMPEVTEIELPAGAEMGVAVEGSPEWWPESADRAVLPALDRYTRKGSYIDVFNRGRTPFEFEVSSDVDWLLHMPAGTVEQETCVWIIPDWEMIPDGNQQAVVTITGPDGADVAVQVTVRNTLTGAETGFIEGDGYVSLHADHFTSAVEAGEVRWHRLHGLGNTGSAMTVTPVTIEPRTPEGLSPRLEYAMHLTSEGPVTVTVSVAPTLNYYNNRGHRYAVSFDDQPPQMVNINGGDVQRAWNGWVSNNWIQLTTEHTVGTPGSHVLKVWMIDPGVVFEKIVVDTGGVKPSYLGPPESVYLPAAAQ